MRYVFVVDEGQRPSRFLDIQEVLNTEALPSSLVIEFFSHYKPGLRMIRDRRPNPVCAFTFAHYLINPDTQEMLPSMLAKASITDAITALDTGKYECVFIGTLTSLAQVDERAIIPGLGLFARRADGQIVDVVNETVHTTETGSRLRIVPLALVVKIGQLPAYAMYLNSDLVRITDGFDYVDEANKISWVKVSGRDTLLNVLYDPQFSANVTITPNDILLVPADTEFAIEFLNPPNSPVKGVDFVGDSNNDWTVVSSPNISVKQQGSKFFVGAPHKGSIGFITIAHNIGGILGTKSKSDRPSYTYFIFPT